jgi:cell division septum initiation protein DivIVA
MQKNDNNHNSSNNNNIGNGANVNVNGEEVLHIGDRSFRKTKLGLAEEEVRAYVEELINQRDALVKRQEHLSALTELAEKTVMDANNLSQAMMKKTTEQAKTEADKIRAKAEQEADQLIKAKRSEAKMIADKDAESIRTEAHRQAKLIREEQLDGIRSEAANLAQKLQSDLIANLDGLKKQVLSIGTKFEPSLHNSNSNSINTNSGNNNSNNNNSNNGNNGKTSHPAPAEAAKPSDTLSPGEKGALLDHIPWLEVEVLPPLDIEKIMDLIARLESLPEVKTTDLLPETPNPLIRVFLNEPSPLAEMLRTLPQVEKVNELTDEGQGDDKRERIQIVLGKNPSKNADPKKGSTIRASS